MDSLLFHANSLRCRLHPSRHFGVFLASCFMGKGRLFSLQWNPRMVDKITTSPFVPSSQENIAQQRTIRTLPLSAANCREARESCTILVSVRISERIYAVMAQQCDICGKKPQSGNRISHAHNVTKRRWNVNLRPVHARVGATTKRMRVCTSCIRSGKVVKA